MSTVRRVTLADVSRAAGLGMATVSRSLAIHDHPDVNPATRNRVRQIAKDLGYRPSATARALRSGDQRALSFIVSDQGWGWTEQVMRSAFQAATREGYQLFVHPIEGMDRGTIAVMEGLANVPTEGVITSVGVDQVAIIEAAERLNLPVIAIDDYSTHPLLPSFASDNRGGAKAAVEHLIGQGRRRIAVLVAWDEAYYSVQRLAGYFDALDAAGIARDDRLVMRCEAPDDESAITWPSLDEALKRGVEFDGIFCIADLLAAPALRSLHAAGRSVPGDVAMIGFDDERAARLLNPQLSTVRQPYELIGEQVVAALLRSIRGEHVPVTRVELPTELIIRKSSVSAAGGETLSR